MNPSHTQTSSERGRQDTRALTQHFNQPGGGIEPWMFVPESNIAEISTAEHPGTATIRQAGRGQDIKGILRQPIGIGDYPLPWEFQMSLVQNPMAVLLGVGDMRQNNTAIALNVALTFSDPALIQQFVAGDGDAEDFLIEEPGQRIEASNDESVLRAARDAARFTT